MDYEDDFIPTRREYAHRFAGLGVFFTGVAGAIAAKVTVPPALVFPCYIAAVTLASEGLAYSIARPNGTLREKFHDMTHKPSLLLFLALGLYGGYELGSLGSAMQSPEDNTAQGEVTERPVIECSTIPDP